MRIPTRTQDRGFPFNITPLIDVVFLLIIFFLVASHFIRNENVERVALPIASQGQADEEPASRMVVTVDATGQFLLGTIAVPLADFEQQFKTVIAQHGTSKTELRIRADRTVPYAKVEPLLMAAARNGVTRVRFAVLKP